MSRYRRFDIVERSPSYFLEKSSIFCPPKTLSLNPFFPSFPIVEDELHCALDLLDLTPNPPLLFDEYDTITDLIQIHETPFHTSTRRITRRVGFEPEFYLQTLSDRVSALESGFDRLVREEQRRKKKIGERKYTWAAELKSPEKEGTDRKYKWIAEIKDGKDEKKGLEKNFKWTAEIKGKGGERTYTVKISSDNSGESEEKKKKCDKPKEKAKKVGSTAHIVEIEEPSNHGVIVLKQAFAKRVERLRGKRKELSPQDAADLIQLSFRAYLIRRSQALRALRELAIAKGKLKELRALFNSSYRRRLVRDAEERQKFTEKIIVLLLTVDDIEGADVMV